MSYKFNLVRYSKIILSVLTRVLVAKSRRMPRRDISVPSWCKCRECCKAPKEDENVCCGVRPCRTEDHKFIQFMECLKETLTTPKFKECENAFFEALSEEKRLKARKIYTDLTDMGKLRRLCYWKTCSFFHDNRWYPQDGDAERYAALPSCVVWVIRRQYKEPQEGRYTGFPPKQELLQKVVDARETFKRDMDVYKTVVDSANPNGGLFSTLHKLKGNDLDVVYDKILLHANKQTEEQTAEISKERWTNSMKKGEEVLPRLGLVACATAFEAFVHDTFKRCLETVFSTRKVSNTDEKLWVSWLQNRTKESEGWQEEENEDETSFWMQFEPTRDVQSDETQPKKTSQNHVLQKLRKYWPKVYKYLTENATSQASVGIVQEMMDVKKNNIMHNLNTKMECVQEKFQKLVQSVNNKKRKCEVRWPGSPPKKQKTVKRTLEVEEKSVSQSPLTISSSISNLSSEITESSGSISTRSSLGSSEVGLPIDSSTPAPGSKRKLQPTRHSPATSAAATTSPITRLITDYARKYKWQVWVDHASYDVKCNSQKSLEYMSTLFYGIRNIFSHGTPEKTLSGALRVDCTPQKSADLSIIIADRNQMDDDPVEVKELCQSYLFSQFKKATTEFNEMHVDHDLFLTAQSFYGYSVEIIGRVAACIVYRYGDVKLRERATEVDMQKVEEIERAWKSADDEIQTDDLSVHGTEVKTTSAGQSTGIFQDFSELMDFSSHDILF